MAREWFEFHCANGCGGYFRLHLDTAEDRQVLMKCPSCQHEHQRYIYQGQVTDKIAGRPPRHGKQESDDVHVIEVPLSAFSRTPQLKALEEKGFLGSLWSRF